VSKTRTPAKRHLAPAERPGGTLVLDSQGLIAFADQNTTARAAAEGVLARGGQIVIAATTLTEVLRGSARDTKIHRVLKTIAQEPITPQLARQAGELLGRSGLDGHTHSLVAAVALACPRPVLLLTSDVDDLTQLTEEPDKPKHARIAVHHV
jgi:predicted nucleic acid-binding protein